MVTATIRQDDIRQLDQQIKKLRKAVGRKEMRKVLVRGSKPYRLAVRRAAPKASKDVHRYSTPKGFSSRRAPKGRGKRVATYAPGNLGRSMKVLPLRRTGLSIVVGPKAVKNSKGRFQGARADGYYAHMIEGGTKHMRARKFVEPSWNSNRSAVISKTTSLIKARLENAI